MLGQADMAATTLQYEGNMMDGWMIGPQPTGACFARAGAPPGSGHPVSSVCPPPRSGMGGGHAVWASSHQSQLGDQCKAEARQSIGGHS
mmetsp:Transcript_46465/g.108223  ORF Transcript_46465/g.108223 Transcript_46465/m.108223 type:complete len:89 (+) Transcript_46465:649-915(+)